MIALLKTSLDSALGIQNYPSSEFKGVLPGLVAAIGTFYTFWDSHFLWFARFSVSTKISVIQIKVMEYFSAFFPLFLILLSWAIIKVYYRFEGSVLVKALKRFFMSSLDPRPY